MCVCCLVLDMCILPQELVHCCVCVLSLWIDLFDAPQVLEIYTLIYPDMSIANGFLMPS